MPGASETGSLLLKRIVITGASGVGKTTLTEALAKRIGLSPIAEVARRICAEMGYGRIGEIPDQEGFKNRVLEEQIASEESLGSFVSDRSAVDCWVLWQRWNISTAMTDESERYYDRCRSQAERYTHVVYIPPMFSPTDDDFRWTDPHYQKQIDRLIRGTLYDWGLLARTLPVRSPDLSARVEEVVAWLESSSS